MDTEFVLKSAQGITLEIKIHLEEGSVSLHAQQIISHKLIN